MSVTSLEQTIKIAIKNYEAWQKQAEYDANNHVANNLTSNPEASKRYYQGEANAYANCLRTLKGLELHLPSHN